MRGMDRVQGLRLGTWLGSAVLKHRLRVVLEGSGSPLCAGWALSTSAVSLSTAHAHTAREQVKHWLVSLAHFPPTFRTDLVFFSFGQDHPSLLGMKIIYKTHWVFPSFIAEYYLLQD